MEEDIPDLGIILFHQHEHSFKLAAVAIIFVQLRYYDTLAFYVVLLEKKQGKKFQIEL